VCPTSFTVGFSADSIIINNLCKCTGEYKFVFSSGSSIIGTQNIFIGTTTLVNVFATNSAISCVGACNATGTAYAFGGTGPYNYTWTPISVHSQVSYSLCPGIYTITVQDSNGCLGFTNLIVINPSNPCVGINEIEKTIRFDIFPNPVFNQVNIVATDKIGYGIIQIYNSTGQVVLESTLTNEIDVSKLIPGLYYLKITTGSDQYYSKILKE